MFRAVIKAIASLVAGIVKGCVWILLHLGMWIPALYALTYLGICLFTGTRLTGIVLTTFFFGLGVAIAGGLLFALYQRSRKKSKRITAPPPRVKKESPKTKYRGGLKKTAATDKIAVQAKAYEAYDDFASAAEEPQYVAAGGAYRNRDAETERVLSQKYLTPAPPVAATKAFGVGAGNIEPSAEELFTSTDSRANLLGADVEIKTESAALRQEMRNADRTDYDYQAEKREDRLGADRLWQRLEGAKKPEERPLVFRTRSDPNVYVYEYSDRLQYWRRSRKGMTLLGTEYKTDKRTNTNR